MKHPLILLMMLLAALYANAQDARPFAVNSAGGSASIGGDTYEWSFAEMMLVNTAVSTNLIVTSGILQPADPFVGVEEPILSNVPMKVYPNPTIDMISLATGFDEPGKLSLQLTDISGKRLDSKQSGISSGDQVTALSLEKYPAGEYVLIVNFKANNSRNYNGIFKIQKLR